MMQQHINLYHYLAANRPVKLSFRRILMLYAAFVIFLLFTHLYDVWSKNRLVATVAAMKVRLDKEQQHLTDVATQFPSLDPQELNKVVAQLKESFGEKSKAIISLVERVRFSEYLKAIAESITPGAWVTSFSITEGGEQVALHGQAFDALQAENFVDRLNQQAIFSQKKLEISELTQDTQTHVVNFSIVTKGKNV